MIAQAWEVVIDLWETGNWYARATIVSVFAPPLIALLLALRGLNVFAMAVALIPLLALVFVPLALLDPLVIVVAAGALGLHPTAAAIRQWLARWIPFYIGSVLTYGVYLFFVPIGNNPVLVLPLIGVVGAMTFFAISSVRGTVVQWTTRALAVIAIVITVAFFFSGRGRERTVETQAQTVEAEAQAPAPPSVDSVKEIVRVPLLGGDILSEASLRSGMIPPRWYYYFEGPPGARIHFDDGTVSPITEWVGLKNGAGRFTGPKGGTVVVRAYPPPQ